MNFLNMKYIYTPIDDTFMSTVDLSKRFNIEIIFDTKKEEINTYIDSNKIERSILNLLYSIIKFTSDVSRIYLSINVNNNEVIIKVQLYLYIVNDLTELQHGTISVERQYGERTTFTITLPIILSIKDNTEFTASNDDLSRLVII